jgi:hypothetical protein
VQHFQIRLANNGLGRVIDLENSTRHVQTSVKRPDLELVQERRKQCGTRYKRVDFNLLVLGVRTIAERSETVKRRDTECAGQIRIAGAADSSVLQRLTDTGRNISRASKQVGRGWSQLHWGTVKSALDYDGRFWMNGLD